MQVSDYQGLITSQHRDKPKFMAMVAAVVAPYVDAQNFAASIPAAFDVDSATGAQLDVVGEWVGQSRVLTTNIPMRFFGFDDTPEGMPFGEETNPSIGSRFREESEPWVEATTLIDPDYRFAIKARIARNTTDGTLDSLIASIEYLTDGASATVNDYGGMTVEYAIGRPLTYIERALIDSGILPKPAGVRISQVVTFNPSGYFGFLGQTGALPFGEDSDPTVGGPFAEAA